jgi:rhodanese-related sulfurtransferase
MMKKFRSLLIANLVLVVAIICLAASAPAEDKRITKEEVKPMIGSPDLIIIDVRSPVEWEKAELKVKGALREDPETATTWMGKYPRDKTLVLYCS